MGGGVRINDVAKQHRNSFHGRNNRFLSTLIRPEQRRGYKISYGVSYPTRRVCQTQQQLLKHSQYLFFSSMYMLIRLGR